MRPSMPIQAPQWTEFLSCPVCYNVFNEKQYRPISLACGHTVCHSCLCKLQQRKCPFDQSLISRDVGELPVNFALLQLVCATALPDSKEECVPGEYKKFYDSSIKHLEELALLLKPVSSSSTGSIITVSSSSGGNSQNAPNSVLSRPMQRKLITLVSCQLVEDEGRARAIRGARSLGERSVTELILQHQNPQQLSSNLWASVRGRGCQFLGPAMQEEVLKLILLALEDGSALSRKVLVLFVVQRLETQYPQASKTAIGHVVQLLYRASCFKVTKREEESSLMQLKEEYRTYEMLRREHDSQIVQIAMEAGLRIAPDQWSSLLYGDATHKSHMQSIIDKLQTPQTFSQSVSELLIALQRTGDPHNLQRLQPELEFLSSIDPSPDIPVPSWENLDGVMKAVHTVVEGLVDFLQNSVPKRQEYLVPHNARYKTSMCRDYAERRNCPRGASCTFAHSEEELDKYRHRNKRAYRGSGSFHHGAPSHVGARPLDDSDTINLDDYRDSRQDLTHVLKSMNINVSAQPLANVQLPPDQEQSGNPDVNAAQPTKHQTGSVPADIPVSVVDTTPVTVAQPTLQVAQPTATSLATVGPIGMSDGVINPTGEVGPPSEDGAGNQQNVTPLTPQGASMQMMPNQMGNMNFPHGMMQGMVLPNNMGIPQGNPGMMQMGHMQGMYPPFMPPYGGPGPGMHGPRFPIHPMMYHGQYPYMHPYMPYYPQGYMTPGDPSRMSYDNYYTSLNPFAEPWNPGSRQRPPMNQGMMYQESSKSGQMETCAACSQREEEQRLQQKMRGEGHLCQHHSPGHHGDERTQGHEEQYHFEAQRENKYNDKTGNQEKYRSKTQQDQDGTERYFSKGQTKHQGQTYQAHKEQSARYQHEENPYEDDNYEYHYQNTKGFEKTRYSVQKGQGQNWKKQYEGQHAGQYEEYDGRGQDQRKVQESGQYDQPDWVATDEDYSAKDFSRGRETGYEEEDAQLYDKHGWSISDNGDGNEDDDSKEDMTRYQYSYRDSYTAQSQYAKSDSHQIREKYPNGGNQRKKQPKVPILYPKEPSAKLHRQSLKNLQERRNTLLAQLQELNKQFEGHYNDKEEIMEEIWSEDTRRLEEKGFNVDQSLPDLFRPQYELMQVDESEAYVKTLEHPHPLDVGPVSLKAELISNGDIFERLGAISGVPPRQVNDSIMTSWMTSSLNNVAVPESEEYSYINTSMSNTVNTKVQNTYTLNNQPTSKPIEQQMSSGQRKKSTDGWRNIDKDFPYWKDVTSNLESPMPTPPATPKPIPSQHNLPTPSHQSVVYNQKAITSQHNLPTPSHQSVVYNQKTITASSISQPYVSSSYTASNYMSSSVSQSNRDKPTYHDSYATPSSWETHHSTQTSVHTPSRNPATTTIYNSIANFDSNDDYLTKKSSYIPSSYVSEEGEGSAYGSGDNYWTTNSQTTTYESSSPLAYFSSTSSNFTEDHIPFVEGSPTISKFGPISRNKQGAKNPVLLKATADETVKILPVTAVTPIEGPPLPNASTVPSRFTREDEGQYSTKEIPVETKVTFDKVYSLWASEVNLLEQKAQEASTEDEKLSVKLQAVEMQITLKQQELKQAQAVNLSTSEYMKRELIPVSKK